MLDSTAGLSKEKVKFLEIYGINANPGIFDAGETLTESLELGQLGTAELSIGGSVNETDTIDVYRFEVLTPSNVTLQLDGLSEDVDLEVIQDFNGNGEVDSGEVLGFSENFGTTPEKIDILLDSGTYFARIRQFEGETDYELRIDSVPFDLPSDNAGNSLADARVIDDLTNPQVLNDFVGALDPSDYYRLTLDTAQELSIQLDGLSSDADIELIRDVNGDGIVQAGEIISTSQLSGNTPETITTDLEAGTYFIHVYPFGGDTNYNLTIESAGLPEDNVGDTLDTALDIGVLSGDQTLSEFISPDDLADIYRFTLNAPSRFQADLTGLSADADLRLVQDKNGDLEVNTDEVLTFSEEVSTISEDINVLLDAGTYFLDVSLFGNLRTGYSLAVSSTPEALPSETAGDSLADARETNLSGDVQTLEGFVGASDISDYYRFSLDEAATVSLALDLQSPDADLLLVQDVNGDGVATPEETIAISERPGVADESITQSLEAGTYFARVRQFRGDSPYALSLSSVVNLPDPEQPIDTIGNTLADAALLDLSLPQTLVESVSSASDPADIFRIELAQDSNFRASLTGLTGDADIELIFDRDSNNEVDSNEVLTFSEEIGLVDEQIGTLLGAGTYFLRVRPFESTASYTLDTSVETTTLPTDGAGNTLAAARSIGELSGAQSFGDFVGSSDLLDVYRFSLGTQSRLTLNLTELSSDVDLELIQDQNGDGNVTPDEKIAISNSASNFDEAIETLLSPGDYFIRVAQFEGDTNYSLVAAANPVVTAPDDNAGNTLASARKLGDLSISGSFSGSDFVDIADPLDFYEFQLSNNSNLQASLSNLTGDVDLAVFRDTNGNGAFEFVTEVIASSQNPGLSNEGINLTGLSTGTYYILVQPVAAEGGSYSISVSAKNFTPPINTPTFGSRAFMSGAGLVDAASAVSSISRRGAFGKASAYTDDRADEFSPTFAAFADYGLNQINAPDVWEQGFTGEGITVAVIDTGIDARHRDLSNNLAPVSTWRDFVENDDNPDDRVGRFEGELKGGHGTHVAGTIAASRNNRGIVGVAYDSNIIPLRTLSLPDENTGNDPNPDAIRSAVDSGAHVINMSLGYYGNDAYQSEVGEDLRDSYRDALRYARDNGTVVVIAAGNNRDDFASGLVTKPGFPARYAEEGLAVAVGASDIDGFIVNFSNPAGDSFQNFVSAPGQFIVSTVPPEYDFVFNDGFQNFEDLGTENRFSIKGGTSMAAPHVSGVVALMMDAFYESEGLDPTRDRLSPEQVDNFYRVLNGTANSEAIVGYIDEVTGEERRF